MAAVVDAVTGSLLRLRLAVAGEVPMTADLAAAAAALAAGAAPHGWLWTAAGDEFSWAAPRTLAPWLASLNQRHAQLQAWLASPRAARRPASFWLPGFFNPAGLLTAMKQEVTRKHSQGGNGHGGGWALDEVVYHTEVVGAPADSYGCGGHGGGHGGVGVDSDGALEPAEGLLVTGLWLEGARWASSGVGQGGAAADGAAAAAAAVALPGGGGCLAESLPKVLFSPLPTLLVSANKAGERERERERERKRERQSERVGGCCRAHKEDQPTAY
jgi:dynein heavy chain